MTGELSRPPPLSCAANECLISRPYLVLPMSASSPVVSSLAWDPLPLCHMPHAVRLTSHVACGRFLAAVDAEAKAGEGPMQGAMAAPQMAASPAAPPVGTILGEMSAPVARGPSGPLSLPALVRCMAA